MHFNNLPDDLVRPVLRAALPAAKHLAADVKVGLGLLSVCRRWRELALPMVYDTVLINCRAQDTLTDNGAAKVDISTMLDLVVSAEATRMVRRLVIGVKYRDNLFPALQEAITRMSEVADEWKCVRKLELGMCDINQGPIGLNRPAAGHEDDIDATSSAIATLMPGLREVRCADYQQTQDTCNLFGRLVWHYANQIQVFHTSHSLFVPQGRVFARLRDVSIECLRRPTLEYQLPRLDPEVVESLVLRVPTANDMWSMFCADADGHAITFPRLTNLRLEHPSRFTTDPEQSYREQPWALQFPAAKRVHIICDDEECPSMENAVFPDRLESLEIRTGLDVLRAIASAKVHVSQCLTVNMRHSSNEDNVKFEVASRIFTAAGPCQLRKLFVDNDRTFAPGLFTYTGLTHLELCGPTRADDVVEIIRRQPHLVSLIAMDLQVADIQTDFSIPACVEHEPVVPLDTQIRKLKFPFHNFTDLSALAAPMLKYLLLKIPTLRHVVAGMESPNSIQEFVDGYLQWYPHLANVKLVP